MFREVLHYRTLFKSLRSLSNNPKGLSLLPNELLANSGLILWEMLGVGIRHDMSIHTGTQMRKYKIRYMQHSVYVQYRQTDRQTGRQTGRQGGRQGGRQTQCIHTINTHLQSIHTRSQYTHRVNTYLHSQKNVKLDLHRLDSRQRLRLIKTPTWSSLNDCYVYQLVDANMYSR